MTKKAEIEKNENGLYVNDFASVLQIIEQNRSQAVQVINHASVLTAWQVGAYISDKIKNAAWGLQGGTNLCHSKRHKLYHQR